MHCLYPELADSQSQTGFSGSTLGNDWISESTDSGHAGCCLCLRNIDICRNSLSVPPFLDSLQRICNLFLNTHTSFLFWLPLNTRSAHPSSFKLNPRVHPPSWDLKQKRQNLWATVLLEIIDWQEKTNHSLGCFLSYLLNTLHYPSNSHGNH